MGLIAAEATLGYLRTYRIVHIGGRYGGGKTALAQKLAADLLESGFCRYLVSNVRSVWQDEPADVVLRDGLYADAVVVLDEGGLFLKSSFDAEKFLAFLRKLNIVLIIPSVLPPSSRVRMLSIQRTMNLQSVGLPLWLYTTTLWYGHVKENTRFGWWMPSEIYGVYDTLGFPSDDAGLGEWVEKWTNKAAKSHGYKEKRGSFSFTGLGSDTSDTSSAADGQLQIVEGLGRVVAALDETAGDFNQAVSLLGQQRSKRGRKF